MKAKDKNHKMNHSQLRSHKITYWAYKSVEEHI